MISELKETKEQDGFESLEKKMVRTLALHREMKKLLEAEYEAGRCLNPDDLVKLTLRKNNCISQFEHLVTATSSQIDRMADQELPNTCPRTLANRVRFLPGFTDDMANTLLPLAREVEAEHRSLVEAARRNVNLLKGVIDRLWAVSRYTEMRNPL